MTKIFSLSAAIFFALLVGTLDADLVTWNIEITIDAAVSPNNTGPTFKFGTLPETFNGTFTADNMSIGPISNLNLTVGVST